MTEQKEPLFRGAVMVRASCGCEFEVTSQCVASRSSICDDDDDNRMPGHGLIGSTVASVRFPRDDSGLALREVAIANAAAVYVDEHYRLNVNAQFPDLFMRLTEALKAYDAAVHESRTDI